MIMWWWTIDGSDAINHWSMSQSKIGKKCDSDKSFSHSFSRKKALSKVYTGIGQILYFIKSNKDISGSWKGVAGVHYMTQAVPAANKLNQHPNKKCMTSFSDSAVIRLCVDLIGGKCPEPWGDATLNLSRCQCYDIWPLSLTNCDSKISEFQRVPAPLAGKPTLPPDSNRLATKC